MIKLRFLMIFVPYLQPLQTSVPLLLAPGYEMGDCGEVNMLRAAVVAFLRL